LLRKSTILWCHSGVTVMLQQCYSGVTVVLNWSNNGVTIMSQGFKMDVTIVTECARQADRGRLWRECTTLCNNHIGVEGVILVTAHFHSGYHSGVRIDKERGHV
jgi:hypothetical protein